MSDIAKAPGCDCADQVDRDLATRNACLSRTLFTGAVLLRTDKLDDRRRGKPAAVLATHCPFCGEPYRAAGLGRSRHEEGDGDRDPA